MKPLGRSRNAALALALLVVFIPALSHADGGAEIGPQGGSPLDAGAVDGMTAAVGTFFNSGSPDLLALQEALLPLTRADANDPLRQQALMSVQQQIETSARGFLEQAQEDVPKEGLKGLSKAELESRATKLSALSYAMGQKWRPGALNRWVSPGLAAAATQTYGAYAHNLSAKQLALMDRWNQEARLLAQGMRKAAAVDASGAPLGGKKIPEAQLKSPGHPDDPGWSMRGNNEGMEQPRIRELGDNVPMFMRNAPEIGTGFFVKSQPGPIRRWLNRQLMFHSMAGNPGLVKFFVSLGADVDAGDINHLTPLVSAITIGAWIKKFC